MTFKEGSIVAEHYQLKRPLGQGSFGNVWLAHNLLADIDVAIKFYGVLDSKGLDEFRNEFKVAYKLRHPNLLNINHFDVYDDCPYLVMPYCAKGSVSHHIGKMPESEIWKFVLDVSGGLAFLHNQQPPIVHQDIKPDNILITSDDRYVITDFGISRSFRTKMSRTNNNISSSGTIAYMGPERFSEKPLVVLASDIWAFGMTLYELMTGDVLWEGMGGCVQLNGARIPAIERDFSPELTNLVTSCLAAETWNRPTAIQIYELASAHLQNKPTAPLRPINPPSKDNITPQEVPNNYNKYKPSAPARNKEQAMPVSINKESGQQRNNSQRYGLVIAAAALLLLALVGVAVHFINKDSEDQISKVRQRIEAIKNKQEGLKPASSQPQQQLFAPGTNQTAPKQTPSKTVKADDRIIMQQSTPVKSVAPFKQTTTTNQQTNSVENDDAIFYACQSVNDYESYLNSFPRGRHRMAAQNAINSLLGRNDNVANGAVPVNEYTNRRRSSNNPPLRYREEVPPPRQSGYGSDYSRGQRQSNHSYGTSGSSNRNGGMRSSSTRSNHSSNRHARSH